MFLLKKAPNPLLIKITNYLQTDKSAEYVRKIYNLINSTSASDLVPSFVFLSRWISENIPTEETSTDEETKNQTAINMIGQISLKLPTVIFLTGFFESSMRPNKPQWLLHDFYLPFYKRIIQLRSYMKPFSLYSQIPSSYQTFPEDPPIVLYTNNNHNSLYESRNYHNFYIELESNPSFRTAILLYFKRMILNHAPIESFKPLVCQRSSRSILTKAIIDLLKELNQTRDATQEELIFAFSSVFLYIHAFVLSNEIDSQMLCEYLQTQSFISPFCALAMVNLIPSNLYLFNLLSPKELSVNLDPQTEIRPSQYRTIDLSKSSKLNGFVSKIPIIMSNHFLSSNLSSTSSEPCNKHDDNEFLSFVHLSSANLYTRMKVVLSVTRERLLGPVQVSSMSILLLRCIIFSVQKTYLDFVDTHMFTDTFISFIRTIFSILTITFSDSLGYKFFDTCAFQRDPRIIDLILRPIVKHLMVISLNRQANDHLTKFCFMASKIEGSRKTAHICIRRLTECGRLVVVPSIVDELDTTNDIFFILEYASSLPSVTNLKTFGEYKSLLRLREHLLARIGAKTSMRERWTFIIEHVDSTVMFNSVINGGGNHKKKQQNANSVGNDQGDMNDVNYNRLILTSLEKLNGHNAVKELNKMIRNSPDDLLSILYIYSMSHFFQNVDFATVITAKMKEYLSKDQYTEDGPSKFELRPVDYAFPFALGLIGRLLVYSYDDLAIELLHYIEKPLFEDQTPLHFIVHFLNRYRPLLRSEMMQVFDRILSSLPSAETLYVRFEAYSEDEKTDKIKRIAFNLLDNDMVLIQKPDVINHEYHSLFTYSLVFSNLSLSLSALSNDEIARLLFFPIEDLSHTWMRRKRACLALAKLASSMNNEVALSYFKLIIARKNSQIVLLCGRLFLLECCIDVYREICIGCRNFLLKKFDKLDLFMKMILPSFVRLNEGEEAALALIEGFLESAGNENYGIGAPKDLIENVLDAIGLFFMKLDLKENAAKVMEMAEKFAPKLAKSVAAIIDFSENSENYWN